MDRLFITILRNVLNFKKPSRVIVTLSIALAAVLVVGCSLNQATSSDPLPWNATARPTSDASAPRDESTHLIEMQIVYEENPAAFFPDMKLVWDGTVYHMTPMASAARGRQIGIATDEFGIWRIYELRGHGRDYLLAVESEDVWRVMSLNPPVQPWGQFILENATDEQRLTRLLSVTLYDDGTAMLAIPPISSFALFLPVYYAFEGGELLFYHERDSVFARFAVIDEHTIEFISSTAVLFADDGARYVAATAPVSAA